MVFSCFAVYVLANNTRVVSYFYRRAWPPLGARGDDSKYGTTRVLFASTYTAKQLKTIYYSLNIFCLSLQEMMRARSETPLYPNNFNYGAAQPTGFIGPDMANWQFQP